MLILSSILPGVPVVWAQPTITKYILPWYTGSPSYTGQIINGPDGNLWFLDGYRIGKISTDGAVTGYLIPTVNAGANEITVGPDGNLWFTESQGHKIGKITPNGVITEYPISAQAGGITTGADGNIWFSEPPSIGKITTGGVLTEYPCAPVEGVGWHLAAGPDGNIWFTGQSSPLNTITPSGVISEIPVDPSLANGFNGIVKGPDGNPWVFPGGDVVDVTSLNSAEEYYLPRADYAATGRDGNLWFTTSGKVGERMSDGAIVEYGTPQANSVVLGPDGNIWFTTSSGYIGKFTPTPPQTLLDISPASMSFSGPVSSAPLDPQTLTVHSSTPLSFTALVDEPSFSSWLKISPSGNLNTDQNIAVSASEVQFNGVPGRKYTGFILLTTRDAIQPVRVTVEGTPPVAGRGDIKVAPFQSSFRFVTQTAPPFPQQISITDVDSLSGAIPLTLSYTITSPSGGHWVTLKQDNVPIANGGSGVSPMTLSLEIDPSGLSAGTYAAVITVTPAGGVPLQLPLQLQVVQNPQPDSPWFQEYGTSPSASSSHITAGPDGNIWFAELTDKIGKITPEGAVTEYPVPRGGNPAWITTGSDGNLWFTERGEIGRITTAGAVTEFASAPSYFPGPIVAGHDGNLWFTDIQSIGKISTAGVVTKYPDIQLICIRLL
ncbi:MAG TPA: hypothetical protein VG675_07090 [Bryobacteraceae bacterium]|nr:hypothetical protein [Bryobacteraceae bacterium]